MFDDEKNVFKPEDFEEDEEFFFGDEEEESDSSQSDQSDDSAEDEQSRTLDYERENSDSIFVEDDGGDVFEDFSDDDESNPSNNEKNDKLNSEDEDNQQAGREIGIDLGTTNSVIAYRNSTIFFTLQLYHI